MSEEQFYPYIAGAIDSSSTVMLKRIGRGFTAVVILKRLDPTQLQLIQTEFGGSIRRIKSSSGFVTELTIVHKNAEIMLRCIRPYMFSKKTEVVDSIIRFYTNAAKETPST